MTKHKRVCEHKTDARPSYHTHNQFGEEMELQWFINGESGDVRFPFTKSGVEAARKFCSEEGGYVMDNYGNIWAGG